MRDPSELRLDVDIACRKRDGHCIDAAVERVLMSATLARPSSTEADRPRCAISGDDLGLVAAP